MRRKEHFEGKRNSKCSENTQSQEGSTLGELETINNGRYGEV